jgi:FAD/FMN-containing dehydrogenase
LPDDENYDTARKVWNGMINRHPAVIVFCEGVDDVISSVNFAQTNNLLVALRSGGHNVAGSAVCEGGIVIDFSRMKNIKVDAPCLIAHAQAGLTWGEFDSATQSLGLATAGGIVSSTGITGLTLGGGIGWLVRKYGLTCDNLQSAEIVTADGRLLTASADENADLFWGIRGGGGNFGIVVAFRYRLHPVGSVLAGMILYPASEAKEVLRFYRDYINTVPEELTTMAAFLSVPSYLGLPEKFHGAPAIAVLVCYTGSIETGEDVLKPLRTFGTPLADLIRAKSYVSLQTSNDAGAPPGLQNYWKSAYLKNLSDDAIETLCRHASFISSPLSQIHIQHLQGAFSRVDEDETAFSHRGALCVLNIVSKWTEPAESDKHIKWTREFASDMEQFSYGVYVNFLGNEGEDRIKEAYSPEHYNRLVELKNKYDPKNFFSLNQNIKPTT